MGKAPKSINKEYTLLVEMLQQKAVVKRKIKNPFTKKDFDAAVNNYLKKW
jgi:hypothetical protein